MARRNHVTRDPDGFRGFHDGPRSVSSRGPGLEHFDPAALEEDLEMRYREIHQIISENRLVIDYNTHLQRELTAAKDEIRRLGKIVPELHAEKDVKVRELVDEGLKLEAELLASESLRTEVLHLRAEVQKLNALRQELNTEVQGLTKDVNQLQGDNKQVIAMRADVNAIHKELVEARRALEYEKKFHEEQVKQKQVLEKNLDSMACEIDKLRAEIPNAERRVIGLGSRDYRMLRGSPDTRYPGGECDDGYSGIRLHYHKPGLSRR